jgi:hypothetical protein
MSPARNLPPSARDAVLAYIDDKNAGTFGHGERERRKFASRLNAIPADRPGYNG